MTERLKADKTLISKKRICNECAAFLPGKKKRNLTEKRGGDAGERLEKRRASQALQLWNSGGFKFQGKKKKLEKKTRGKLLRKKSGGE